jgi:hypothetical protein
VDCFLVRDNPGYEKANLDFDTVDMRDDFSAQLGAA